MRRMHVFLLVALLFALLPLLGVHHSLNRTDFYSQATTDKLLERASLVVPTTTVREAVRNSSPKDSKSLKPLLEALHGTRYLIAELRYGLGNRLRTLASAMAVAAAIRRPVAIVWASDRHLNCSFQRLFQAPYPFLLLEASLWPGVLRHRDQFQVYNYMHGEEAAERDAFIDPDPRKHLYFRSAFMMNHSAGSWGEGAWHLQHSLAPLPEISAKVFTSRGMIGLHVRSVIVDSVISSGRVASHSAALSKGDKEYGKDSFGDLKRWRNLTQAAAFIPRMREHLRQRNTHFYLAADAESTYTEMLKAFPAGTVLFTPRKCSDPSACDSRECDGVRSGLVDMLNLARTGAMLGSVGSSYSEVAAYIGAREKAPGEPPKPVPMELAGIDFGFKRKVAIYDPVTQPSQRCPSWEDIMNTRRTRRWRTWQDEAARDLSNLALERPWTRFNCSEGCVMSFCDHGNVAPCCVRRRLPTWPVPCKTLSYGCAFSNAKEVVGVKSSIMANKRKVVLTMGQVPTLLDNETCPSREDVLNTPAQYRWQLWEDKECTDQCWLRHNERGKLAPGCVKRRTAIWDARCESLPYGCYDPEEQAEARVVDNRPPPCTYGLASCVGTDFAVPRLAPSEECPSREDVLNTLSKKRWKLWDDATCEDGCGLALCKGGSVAPCCVKRRRAVFRVVCDVMVHGCFDPISWHSLLGRVVWDKRRPKYLVWGGRWLYVILRWTVMAAVAAAAVRSMPLAARKARMTTAWLVTQSKRHGPRIIASGRRGGVRICCSAAARRCLSVLGLLVLMLAWLRFLDAYTNDEESYVEPNGSLAQLMDGERKG